MNRSPSRYLPAIAGAALILISIAAPTAVNAQETSNAANDQMSASRSQSTQSDNVVLDPGTVIPVKLNNEISSNGSTDGDTFTANVDTSNATYNRIMQNATVDGIVRHAVAQSGTDPGTLELAFTRLRLQNGDSYPISGTVTSLDAKDLQVKSNGVLQAVKTNKDQSLTYAGYGAGAGLLVGVLSGGKIRLEDLLLGGGLGYAAGQLLKGTQQVHDVDLKPGTPVGVLLGKRVLYHRRLNSSVQKMDIISSSQPISSAHKMDILTTSHPTSGVKYYSYRGHPYSLNLATGRRVRLDQ